MKKILVFILTMIASFMLVACGSDTLVVEFDTAGGSSISNVELELEKLGEFKLPENPVKEGFEFKGWYLDENFTKEFVSLEGLEGTVKLYAKWEEVKQPVNPVQTYKVSFYVDGELLETYEGAGLALVYPETPEKDGKVFMGWYEDSECSVLFKALSNDTEIALYGKYVEVAEDSVVVKYIINGQAYSNEMVKKSGFAVKAPELDENVEFLGWYKDVTLTEEFDALADEKEVVLYGVSMETINGSSSFKLSTTLEMGMGTEVQKQEVEVKIDVQAKNFNLLKLEQSELALTFAVSNPVEVDSEEKISLYLKDSKLYADEAGEISYIDLSKVMPKLTQVYKEYIAMLEEQQGQMEENPEMNSASQVLLDALTNLELTAEQETALKELFDTLKPTEVKEGDTVTYTITDAQIQSFISKLAEFVTNHAKDMFGDVMLMFLGYAGGQQGVAIPEYVDEEGNVFTYGEPGWTDVNGVFHNYAEDTEFNYGMVTELGYYVPYYIYGTAFDINDNYKLVLGEASMLWEKFEEIFITYDPEGWYQIEDGKKVFHNISEDFTKQQIGYVEEGLYYSPSGNIYNVETGEKVSIEDLAKEELDAMIEEFVGMISMVSTLFKANALQSKVTIYDNDGGFKLELLGDIEINQPAEDGTQVKITYKLNEVIELNISKDVPTINYPSFDDTLDVTDNFLADFGIQ